MTVLKKEELFNYLNTVVDKIKEETKNNISHQYTADFLESEINFLKTNHEEPTLSFAGNGFPSIESITQDYNEIASLNGKVSNGKEYNYASKHEDLTNYKNVDEKTFKKAQKNNNIINKEVTLDFKLNSEKAFTTNATVSYFIEGIDEHSKNTPLLIQKHENSYQIIFNQLFSTSSTTNFIHNQYKPISKSNKIVSVRSKNNSTSRYGDIEKTIHLRDSDITRIKYQKGDSKILIRKPRTYDEHGSSTVNFRIKNTKIFNEMISHYFGEKVIFSNFKSERKGDWAENLLDFDITELKNISDGGKKYWGLLSCKDRKYGSVYISRLRNPLFRSYQQDIRLRIFHQFIPNDETFEKLTLGLDLIQDSNTIEELIEKIESGVKK